MFRYSLLLLLLMTIVFLCLPLAKNKEGAGLVRIDQQGRGTLLAFQGKKKWPLRCTIRSKKPLSIGTLVKFNEGRLKELRRGFFVLSILDAEVLEKKSIATLRARTKDMLQNYFRRCITQKRTQDLAINLMTGESVSEDLVRLFRHLGLSHLLVISGFHFMLLTMLGSKVFKIRPWILLLILTLYFIFLGFSPSVGRAYCGILMYLVCHEYGFKIDSLNIWGFSCIISLAFDPYLLFHLGFQLSYAATLGILLYFKRIHEKLDALWPTSKFLGFFKPICSITLAVNIFAFPIIAIQFQTLSPIGIVYNVIAAPLFIVVFLMLVALLPFSFLLPIWEVISEQFLEFLRNYPVFLSQPIKLSPFGVGIVCFISVLSIVYLDSKRLFRLKSSLIRWRS